MPLHWNRGGGTQKMRGIFDPHKGFRNYKPGSKGVHRASKVVRPKPPKKHKKRSGGAARAKKREERKQEKRRKLKTETEWPRLIFTFSMENKLTEPDICEAVASVIKTWPESIEFGINAESKQRTATVAIQTKINAVNCKKRLNERVIGTSRVTITFCPPITDAEVPWWRRASSFVEVLNLPPSVTELDILRLLKTAGHNTRYGMCPGDVRVKGINHSADPSEPSTAIIDCCRHDVATTMLKPLRMLTVGDPPNDRKTWARLCSDKSRHGHRNKKLLGTSNTVTVWNIHSAVRNRELADLCWKHGDVHGVNIDALRRIASVRMDSADSASAVFNDLHGKNLHGLTLQTAFHTDTKSFCIKPIPRRLTECEVTEFVHSGTGLVPLSVEVRGQSTDKGSARCAFVHMDHPGDVSIALWKLSGKRLQNVEVRLSQSESKYTNPFHDDPNNFAERGAMDWVKITNIPLSVDEQDLLDHFQESGGIKHPPKRILIRRHLTYRDMTARAMVQLQNERDAKLLVHHLRMREIEKGDLKQKLWVDLCPRFKLKTERRPHLKGRVKRVKLKNVHWGLCTHSEVRKLCELYGVVEGVKLLADEEGYGTGEVLVDMVTNKNADKLFKGLHGKRMNHMTLSTEYDPDNRWTADKEAETGKVFGKKTDKKEDPKKAWKIEEQRNKMKKKANRKAFMERKRLKKKGRRPGIKRA